jgi:cytoskeletal protein CcmA (bactofilin family)
MWQRLRMPANSNPKSIWSLPSWLQRDRALRVRRGTTVTGPLVSAGTIRVLGRVEGDIRAADLEIGRNALVKGDIYADAAVIHGRIEGSIHAHAVQLTATAHVEGTIVHDRALSVDLGAHFVGDCRHSARVVRLH